MESVKENSIEGTKDNDQDQILDKWEYIYYLIQKLIQYEKDSVE